MDLSHPELKLHKLPMSLTREKHFVVVPFLPKHQSRNDFNQQSIVMGQSRKSSTVCLSTSNGSYQVLHEIKPFQHYKPHRSLAEVLSKAVRNHIERQNRRKDWSNWLHHAVEASRTTNNDSDALITEVNEDSSQDTDDSMDVIFLQEKPFRPQEILEKLTRKAGNSDQRVNTKVSQDQKINTTCDGLDVKTTIDEPFDVTKDGTPYEEVSATVSTNLSPSKRHFSRFTSDAHGNSCLARDLQGKLRSVKEKCHKSEMLSHAKRLQRQKSKSSLKFRFLNRISAKTKRERKRREFTKRKQCNKFQPARSVSNPIISLAAADPFSSQEGGTLYSLGSLENSTFNSRNLGPEVNHLLSMDLSNASTSVKGIGLEKENIRQSTCTPFVEPVFESPVSTLKAEISRFEAKRKMRLSLQKPVKARRQLPSTPSTASGNIKTKRDIHLVPYWAIGDFTKSSGPLYSKSFATSTKFNLTVASESHSLGENVPDFSRDRPTPPFDPCAVPVGDVSHCVPSECGAAGAFQGLSQKPTNTIMSSPMSILSDTQSIPSIVDKSTTQSSASVTFCCRNGVMSIARNVNLLPPVATVSPQVANSLLFGTEISSNSKQARFVSNSDSIAPPSGLSCGATSSEPPILLATQCSSVAGRLNCGSSDIAADKHPLSVLAYTSAKANITSAKTATDICILTPISSNNGPTSSTSTGAVSPCLGTTRIDGNSKSCGTDSINSVTVSSSVFINNEALHSPVSAIPALQAKPSQPSVAPGYIVALAPAEINAKNCGASMQTALCDQRPPKHVPVQAMPTVREPRKVTPTRGKTKGRRFDSNARPAKTRRVEISPGASTEENVLEDPDVIFVANINSSANPIPENKEPQNGDACNPQAIDASANHPRNQLEHVNSLLACESKKFSISELESIIERLQSYNKLIVKSINKRERELYVMKELQNKCQMKQQELSEARHDKAKETVSINMKIIKVKERLAKLRVQAMTCPNDKEITQEQIKWSLEHECLRAELDKLMGKSPAEPAKESANKELPKESATAKPDKESATAKLDKESATAKPAKENATAKPAKESATAKPAKESATAKPAKESAAAKPAKETPPLSVMSTAVDPQPTPLSAGSSEQIGTVQSKQTLVTLLNAKVNNNLVPLPLSEKFRILDSFFYSDVIIQVTEAQFIQQLIRLDLNQELINDYVARIPSRDRLFVIRKIIYQLDQYITRTSELSVDSVKDVHSARLVRFCESVFHVLTFLNSLDFEKAQDIKKAEISHWNQKLKRIRTGYYISISANRGTRKIHTQGNSNTVRNDGASCDALGSISSFPSGSVSSSSGKDLPRSSEASKSVMAPWIPTLVKNIIHDNTMKSKSLPNTNRPCPNVVVSGLTIYDYSRSPNCPPLQQGNQAQVTLGKQYSTQQLSYHRPDYPGRVTSLSSQQNVHPCVQEENVHLNCGFCNKPTNQRCGGCQFMSYCSAECQMRDWDSHQSSCSGASC